MDMSETARPIRKARRMRREATEAEDLMWRFIRNSHTGYKFRRQVPIGPYITDFACLPLKLVVEIDGGQHCENKKDEKRTKFLNSIGYEVVRFWNNEVLENLAGVVSTLTLTLSQRERGLKGGNKGCTAVEMCEKK